MPKECVFLFWYRKSKAVKHDLELQERLLNESMEEIQNPQSNFDVI